MSNRLLTDGLAWGKEAQVIINNILKLIVDASTTVVGLVRLATNAETTTGTSTTLATTPAGVKAVTDALKAAANTWTAAQTITVTAGGIALNLQSNDAGAGAGPDIFMRRASASPAVSDIITNLQFNGNDSGGNSTDYASIFAQILDPTDTSEDGRLFLRAAIAGTLTIIITVGPGVQIGAPTGGDKGAGTLNLDNDLYKDGTKVVGAQRTGWAATTGTELRTNFGDASLSDTSQALRALIVDLKAHGLIGA